MHAQNQRCLSILTTLLLSASTYALFAQPSVKPSTPVLRIVYFIPADRTEAPQFRERLTRVMQHVQAFYRTGMQQHGYGPCTFPLDTDPDGLLALHRVKGRFPAATYGRNDAARVRQEVKEALLRENLDIDGETIVIFQRLLDWKNNVAIEVGPFVGGGDPASGTAYVYDDERLDALLLTSTTPGGYYGKPCSLGQFNTHYIGGIAHELGHALGLPHDCETPEEHQSRGASLMGGGNHRYGKELRKEGRGAFLSAASALPLSRHPLFTGKRIPAETGTAQLTALHAVATPGGFIVSGTLAAAAPVIGCALFNDPEQPSSDYDAMGWIGQCSPSGTIRFAVQNLKPGKTEARMRFYYPSGRYFQQTFSYSVSPQKQADLAPFNDAVSEQQAYQFFRDQDDARLHHLANDPALSAALRAKINLLCTLRQAAPPAIPAATATTAFLSDIPFTTASTGWGKPLRNRVFQEARATPLLEVGTTYYEKGLYAHAPSCYTYALDGTWKKLSGACGVQNGHAGSVVFVIRVDGQERFRSELIKDHTPRSFTLDMRDARSLDLSVEDGGNGTHSDWGVWLSPRIER